MNKKIEKLHIIPTVFLHFAGIGYAGMNLEKY